METDRLRQFCLIVETGSMTRSAQLLNLTHSALSKSMKLLQQSLGFSLLQPDGRGLSVTHAGLEIYRKSKLLLESEEQLFRKETSPQALRVGVLEIFLPSFCEGMARQPFLESPVTLLDVHPGEMEQLVARRELDMGVTYVPFPTEGVEIVEVGRYGLGCYARKGAFKGMKLSEIPFVVPAQGLSSNPLGIKQRDGWLEGLYTRKKKYFVNLLSTGIELALQGECAIYIPHFVARKQSGLVEIPLPSEIRRQSQKAFVIRHKSQPEGVAFKRLTSIVRQLISAK